MIKNKTEEKLIIKESLKMKCYSATERCYDRRKRKFNQNYGKISTWWKEMNLIYLQKWNVRFLIMSFNQDSKSGVDIFTYFHFIHSKYNEILLLFLFSNNQLNIKLIELCSNE